MANEWAAALKLALDIVKAADALQEAMTGRLAGVSDRAGAAVEIARRIDAYRDARNALIAYAREVEEAMA